MNTIVYVGHNDDFYGFFSHTIKRKKDNVCVCVNDVFEYEQMLANGVNAYLSECIPDSFTKINSIAISTGNYESKAQIVKRIVLSYNRLLPNGELSVITSKRTGFTTVTKVLKLLKCEIQKKSFQEVIVLNTVKTTDENVSLEEIYSILSINNDKVICETIANFDFIFYTEPSLFSKERIDRGSVFLLNSISVSNNDVVLDYGCGYGVIGIVVAKIFKPKRVDFIDIKSEAKDKTLQNIRLNQINVNHNVFLATNLSKVYNNYSLILSHFPIHVSTKSKYEMLEECKKGLKKNGKMICVIPQTFNFEKMVTNVFGNYKVIANNDIDSYYIFEAINK